MEAITAQDIIQFWFADNSRKHWFKSSAAFDQQLTERFANVLQAAAKNQHDNWTQTAEGTLALIIVLDQFSRNIYRGTDQAYANDAQACKQCKSAIDKGFDQTLDGWRKGFLYMPLMHSESIGDQNLSVEKFTAAGLDNASYALHHREIIRRFGRFPHRNKILGRVSAADERAYLDSDEAFNG